VSLFSIERILTNRANPANRDNYASLPAGAAYSRIDPQGRPDQKDPRLSTRGTWDHPGTETESTI
jgi:hypothetical protein